jgi:hypothetical protein
LLGLAAGALLALPAAPSASAQVRTTKPTPNPAANPANLVSRVLDACRFAPADTLAKYLGAGIDPYFPIEAHQNGQHLKIGSPSVTEAKCPDLRVALRANLKYQDTRGLVQYEASGHLRFGSPLSLLVVYWSRPGQTVKPADVVSAKACFSDISVIELNLKNVPNWIDNSYIRSKVQDKLVPNGCVLVLTFVRLYLASGGTL